MVDDAVTLNFTDKKGIKTGLKFIERSEYLCSPLTQCALLHSCITESQNTSNPRTNTGTIAIFESHSSVSSGWRLFNNVNTMHRAKGERGQIIPKVYTQRGLGTATIFEQLENYTQPKWTQNPLELVKSFPEIKDNNEFDEVNYRISSGVVDDSISGTIGKPKSRVATPIEEKGFTLLGN